MGLFVRDECEKSMKNQGSKVESVDFATGSQWLSKSNPRKGHVWST